MINRILASGAAGYRGEFLAAEPFPHVVIDSFFDERSAETLLADFPPFDADHARNEFGLVGRKAAVTDIATISPAYAALATTLGSREFLDVMTALTGIPDLVHDPRMFGGGTHENLEGQKLDPHVDFNRLGDGRLHRRLNLLVYLNRKWDEGWGGCLELHSNPRRPAENQIRAILPLFNRAVLFETSERSWHGFPEIRLPEDARHLSRRAISVYLYTRDRPAAELTPPHGTFYVQRPAPGRLRPGYTLTEGDVQWIGAALVERDGWIEYYQNLELSLNGRIEALEAEIRSRPAPKLPLAAGIRVDGPVEGYWEDGWIGNSFRANLRAEHAISGVEIEGYLPEGSGSGRELEVSLNGNRSLHSIGTGPFRIRMGNVLERGEVLSIRIASDTSHCPARAGTGPDLRELVALLTGIRLIPSAPR